MEQTKYSVRAEQILDLAGGPENISAISCCMTRLRLDIIDFSKTDITEIKKLKDVMGTAITGGQLQIILGPGKAERMKTEFINVIESRGAKIKTKEALSVQSKIKEAKEKGNPRIKKVLKSLANIFVPLIPGFIGCGLILAANNTLNNLYPAWSLTAMSKLLAIFGGAIYTGLGIFVGINTAKEIGGTAVIGGIMAVILASPGLSDINFFGHQLMSARGGIIAVLFVCAFASWLEVQLRKFIPETLNLFLSSVIVIFVSGIFAIFLLQPLGEIISNAIITGINFALTHGGALTGFILAGTFLPVVMVGLHQGISPIHAQLITEFGYTVLFPIFAMAGAGQVGAALAVLIKTKNPKLKKTLYSALPIGIFGVGEPLIYGVTLPLGKPFIAACIGGAFGGAVIAVFKIGATVIGGLSGLPLVFLTTKPFLYLTGLLTAYAAGFIATLLIGFDDSQYGKEE